MSTPIADYKREPRRLELAPNEAVSVIARRGTEVRVDRGLVWITQEGDGEDYVVAAGSRFCSGYDGKIVVSALSGASDVTVSWTDPRRTGGYARSGVWLDYGRIARMEQRARRERAKAIGALLRTAAAGVIRLWRRAILRRKPAIAAPR